MRAGRDGTLQLVRRCRLTLLLAGLVLVVAGPQPAALAQSDAEIEQMLEQGADALGGGAEDFGDDTLDPADSGGGVVGGEVGTEPSDDAAPDDFDIDPDFDLSPELPEAPPAADAGPPLPPPYYAPGPGVAAAPVSSVAGLAGPQLTVDPLRAAGLVLVALLLLAIALSALSRALGWREPLGSPVAAPPSRRRRLADAMATVADDMRDFVRRRR